jgi:hypothetical protein
MKKIYLLLLSLITSFSLIVSIDSKGIVMKSLSNNFLLLTVLFVFISFIYIKYYFNYKNYKSFMFVSALFTYFMVFGYSYSIVGNSSLVFNNILVSIFKIFSYYTLFNFSIKAFYNYITKIKFKNSSNKFIELINKHPFLFSFIFITICYIPYMISFYPVVINYDAANQIKEVMGMHTRYLDSVVLLDPSMTITNFNPILHTFLLGGLFKLGHSIGNVNFGLFLYSIVQITIFVSALAYSIYYMKKEKVNDKLIMITLFIYALVPFFPFYAMTAVKDTIFSAILFVYIIKLYDIIKNNQTTKSYIIFFIISLLMVLMRNNGIYIIFLSIPFMILVLKAKRRQLGAVLFGIVILYGAYNSVLLPHFKIANTSVREVLSIPFQQTARFVKYHDDLVSEEDKAIIDKILTYDTLGERYLPRLSDPVKNEFNKHYTNEDLNEYFGVWFKHLLKRPDVYVNATINNVYGYFYPNTRNWYVYTGLNEKLPEAGFDYHFNDFKTGRNILSDYAEYYRYIPAIGLLI